MEHDSCYWCCCVYVKWAQVQMAFYFIRFAKRMCKNHLYNDIFSVSKITV